MEKMLQEIREDITFQKVVKHTVKDSVFTDLFRDKKYLLQLYQALHPEDAKVTEAEITDITIKNVLMDGIYNDLGFLVGDRLVILVEAQSTWTVNIIIRSLLYLVQTYHDYFKQRNENLYGSKKVKMPKPELYVIYTGDRTEKPEYIYLSKEFFEGQECAIEVKVKVIYEGQPENIINQYIIFTKVYNEQRKQYGRTLKAIQETIRICKDRNVLKEYLESREMEVVSMMMDLLFDDEVIYRCYIESKKREIAEMVEKETAERVEKETAERVEKETAERVEKETAERVEKEIAKKMLWTGKFTVEEIAQYIPRLPIEDIRRLQQEMQQE